MYSVGLVGMVLLTVGLALQAFADDAKDLLNKLGQQQLVGHTLRVQSEYTSEGIENGQSGWCKVASDLRTDGTRIEQLSQRSDRLLTPDPLGDARFTYQTHLLVESDVSYWFNGPIQTGALGNVSVTKNPQLFQKQISGSSEAILLGYFARDPELIASVMKTGNPSVSPGASNDGTPCFVLESQTPEYGLYKVWLDSTSYAIKQVQINKGAGDWFSVKPLAGPDDPMLPRDPWPTSVTYVYEVKEFQKIESQWLPNSSDSSLTMTFPDKTAFTSNVHCQRRKIDLHPDLVALKAFVLEIPDGAIAFPPENPGGNYIWKGGKIVPTDGSQHP
jgi:hypothetical protein